MILINYMNKNMFNKVNDFNSVYQHIATNISVDINLHTRQWYVIVDENLINENGNTMHFSIHAKLWFKIDNIIS